MNSVFIRKRSLSDPTVLNLCHELDLELNELAGGVRNREGYLPYNALSDLQWILALEMGGHPVGCAGIKRLDQQTAEIKRVYLKPSCRRRGLGRQLLLEVESYARRDGYSRLVLESGDPLVSAMDLYRSLGYSIMPNFGPYANLPQSICMEKYIVN